ncbi:OmpA family protein [Sulfurimonas sp. MAG313]|nr:OmpA family protein [Sulfurimonas sp. MAG313]MDF1881542.1 OmpA family protein [Sulfurimonas sp. MAG313]
MKQLLAISAIAALLVFSGCSQKDPSIDATNENNSASTVDINDPSANSTSGMDDSGMDQSGSDGMDTTEQTLSSLEAKLQAVTFDFDKFEIKSSMQSNLNTNAALAKADASAYNVKLEGNCDEWGSDEYNYALGLKRAKAAKDAMINEGVSATRITMVSFGESNPTCTEQTQDCWAQNRRVDFKLLP